MKSKKEKIIEKTIEILRESSLHGLPNIMRTSNLLVIFMWSFFLFSSTCAGSYFSIRAILDYLEFRTVNTFDIIKEQYSQFPTISFCFQPQINSSLNEIITRLRFERVDMNRTDFNKYFQEFQDPEYGRCFRFNSGTSLNNQTYDLLNSTKSGLSYGLRMELYLNQDGKYDYVDLIVSVHNKSLPPIEIRSGGGLWSNTGSQIYYQVERIFNQHLSQPYSTCLKDLTKFTKDKTLVDLILKQNRTYSQNDCLLYCSFLFALEENKCGCNSSLERFAWDCQKKPYELSDSIKNCVADKLREFRKNFQFEKCSKYCPLECDSISYSITPLSKSIPGIGEIDDTIMAVNSFNLSNLNTYEDIKRHYVQLCVYYKNLEYTYIDQEAKTETFNFISNMGGILGLFLGISFLSFVEILEILIEYISILFENKKQQKIEEDIQIETSFEESISMKNLNANKTDIDEINSKIEFILKSITRQNELLDQIFLREKTEEKVQKTSLLKCH